MTGLDKMKSQILDEAKAAADAKIQEANEKASGILAAANAEAEKTKANLSQKSEQAVKNYKDRVASAADLQRRTKILAAKQELIAEVLEKAYASLAGLDTKEYFDMIKKMAEKYVLAEDGEIFFSPEDIARMPAGFEAELKKAADTKGGSLVVSKEGRNIENGFVLAYGGIEENCTLRAMFDAKKDELADKVHQILFL